MGMLNAFTNIVQIITIIVVILPIVLGVVMAVIISKKGKTNKDINDNNNGDSGIKYY